MLELCNQLKESLFILGDFNVHFDRAATVRMNELLQMFDLDQAVRRPTHSPGHIPFLIGSYISHGHILDWIVHLSWPHSWLDRTSLMATFLIGSYISHGHILDWIVHLTWPHSFLIGSYISHGHILDWIVHLSWPHSWLDRTSLMATFLIGSYISHGHLLDWIVHLSWPHSWLDRTSLMATFHSWLDRTSHMATFLIGSYISHGHILDWIVHLSWPHSWLDRTSLMATFLIGSYISHGHILDWIVHLSWPHSWLDRTSLMATFLFGSYIARVMIFSNQPVSHLLTSYHTSVMCTLRFKFQKTHQCTSQHATWNHWSWGIQRSDGHLCFSIATIDSAHWVSEVCVRQVCPSNTRGSAITQILPWFASVSEQLLYFKCHRRKTERRWLKSGLTVDRQVFSRRKQQVTQLLQLAKTAYYSAKLSTSATYRELFLNVNTVPRKVKPSTFPTTHTVELPGVFSDFFQSKIAALCNNLDRFASSPSELSRENLVDVLW